MTTTQEVLLVAAIIGAAWVTRLRLLPFFGALLAIWIGGALLMM